MQKYLLFEWVNHTKCAEVVWLQTEEAYGIYAYKPCGCWRSIHTITSNTEIKITAASQFKWLSMQRTHKTKGNLTWHRNLWLERLWQWQNMFGRKLDKYKYSVLTKRFAEWVNYTSILLWLSSKRKKTERRVDWVKPVCVLMWTVTQCFHTWICRTRGLPQHCSCQRFRHNHIRSVAGRQSASNTWYNTKMSLVTAGLNLLLSHKTAGSVNMFGLTSQITFWIWKATPNKSLDAM